ncbi:hypothetical protein ACJIZ3_003413 [Penstemon smallii]|uniref:Uncharacterized protein n=1 Tax=Penstemon smallii TaxID=265156 RepID=A0ABD3UC80_9LAMI
MNNDVGVDVVTDDPNNPRANYAMFTHNMGHVVYCPVTAGLMEMSCQCGVVIGWHLKNEIHFIPCDHIILRCMPRNSTGYVDRRLTEELPWTRRL